MFEDIDERSSDASKQNRYSVKGGMLALELQEALSATVRLRSDTSLLVHDSQSFRANMKQLLSRADRAAREAGYPEEYVRLALYAVVALIDESVFNSSQPVFRDWQHQPLQEDIFGEHTAGEGFYHHLDGLLSRQDSEALADLLEVYLLCLLLGFRGRYGGHAEAERASRVRSLSDKIRRVRGRPPSISPAGMIPRGDQDMSHNDPWGRRIGISAFASVLFVTVMYFALRISQEGWIEEIQRLSAGIGG